MLGDSGSWVQCCWHLFEGVGGSDAHRRCCETLLLLLLLLRGDSWVPLATPQGISHMLFLIRGRETEEGWTFVEGAPRLTAYMPAATTHPGTGEELGALLQRTRQAGSPPAQGQCPLHRPHMQLVSGERKEGLMACATPVHPFGPGYTALPPGTTRPGAP